MILDSVWIYQTERPLEAGMYCCCVTHVLKQTSWLLHVSAHHCDYILTHCLAFHSAPRGHLYIYFLFSLPVSPCFVVKHDEGVGCFFFFLFFSCARRSVFLFFPFFSVTFPGCFPTVAQCRSDLHFIVYAFSSLLTSPQLRLARSPVYRQVGSINFSFLFQLFLL